MTSLTGRSCVRQIDSLSHVGVHDVITFKRHWLTTGRRLTMNLARHTGQQLISLFAF